MSIRSFFDNIIFIIMLKLAVAHLQRLRKQMWYNFSALGHLCNTRDGPAQLKTNVMNAK